MARQLQAVGWTDAEIRRITRLASQEAERIARTSNSLRAAQVRLAAHQAELWRSVGDAVEGGIGDGVTHATEYGALFDEDLMARAGIAATHWRTSQLATAQQGMVNLISRKENGITLSQRVWRNTQAAQRGLDETINVGLAIGKSPAEIAKDVRRFISPDVPGGASYAAMRLGRSEVLNAYHTTSINKMKETPWIEAVKWNLSGSHPRPDECNEYADSGNLAGDGLWSPDQVPAKPHPNCLCYVTSVSPSLDEFARRYKNGEYDSYIGEQMGCARS